MGNEDVNRETEQLGRSSTMKLKSQKRKGQWARCSLSQHHDHIKP